MEMTIRSVPGRATRGLFPFISGQLAIEGRKYLRRLYETEIVIVHESDGTETFAGSGIFLGGVYGETLPIGGKPTKMKNVTVNQIVTDGNFSQILESLGEDRRRWTEAQVVMFCRYHRDKLKNHELANFFEMEGGFVADVNIDLHNQLCVHVFRLSYNSAWKAKYQHRVMLLL